MYGHHIKYVSIPDYQSKCTIHVYTATSQAIPYKPRPLKQTSPLIGFDRPHPLVFTL